MRKALCLLPLLLVMPFMVYAQDNAPDVDEWEDYQTDVYARGDQTFIINLGVIFPLFFLDNNGGTREMNFTPPIGGSGSLIYNYFFNSGFFVGGEISGHFLSSIAGDTLYIVPLGARAGYQFVIGKFEIPLTFALGMSWQRFLDSGYYGMYLKGGADVYYRATNMWSFGLSTSWYWLPQWTSDPAKDTYGNFLSLLLAARYHF